MSSSLITPPMPPLPPTTLVSAVQPPVLPTWQAQPSYSADAFGPNPYYAPTQPDVFDSMRDVSQNVARGVNTIGREVGEALPVVGRTLADTGASVGRGLYHGGKEVVGVLPSVGRGLWGAVSWVGETFMAAGRWFFGVNAPQPLPFLPGTPPTAVMVEPGDTLRNIAKQFLGDGARWKEIYDLNIVQIDAAGGLRAGMVLVLPPANAPTPVQPHQPLPVGQRHTIKKGDTLWALAERFYGDATRWREIQAANPTKAADPRRLVPGQVLLIP